MPRTRMLIPLLLATTAAAAALSALPQSTYKNCSQMPPPICNCHPAGGANRVGGDPGKGLCFSCSTCGSCTNCKSCVKCVDDVPTPPTPPTPPSPPPTPRPHAPTPSPAPVPTPPPHAPPLRSEDLVRDDVFTMSHAGSHHYLKFDAQQFGLGTMGFVNVNPLFDSLGRLSITSSSSPSAQPEDGAGNTYAWRPDLITQTGSSGRLQIKQESFYSDMETINCNLTLKAAGTPSDGNVTVSLSGSLHVGKSVVTSNVSTYQAGQKTTGAAAAITFVPDTWGGADTPVHMWAYFTLKGLTTTATTAPEIRVTTNSKNTWTVSVDMAPGTDLSLQAEMAFFNESTSRPDPAPRSSQSTKAEVDEWLSAVNTPTAATGLLSNYTQLKMYYNSWSQFWYNIEHAQGYWSHDIITPSMSTYARGIWLWDTGFHVMALQHGGERGIALAKNQIQVLCDASKLRMKVGAHIPRVVHMFSFEDGTQPPGILTWASMLLYNRSKAEGTGFLQQVYPVFAQNNDWFYATRDPDHDGLCEWDKEDSGWDTSPRWDNGTVEAIDLNAWLCLDQQILSQMATVLGNSSGAAYWAKRADQTKKLVQDNLWSEKLGVYLDRLPKNKALVETITPATFWALLANIATPEQAERMVNSTLDDPAQLGTHFPMPCVSRSDPRFQPTNYWRGPVWINVNYLTILGLRNYGMTERASKLRQQTIDLVTSNPVPREYYNPLTGGGLGALNFQWTGALFVALVNEP